MFNNDRIGQLVRLAMHHFDVSQLKILAEDYDKYSTSDRAERAKNNFKANQFAQRVSVYKKGVVPDTGFQQKNHPTASRLLTRTVTSSFVIKEKGRDKRHIATPIRGYLFSDAFDPRSVEELVFVRSKWNPLDLASPKTGFVQRALIALISGGSKARLQSNLKTLHLDATIAAQSPIILGIHIVFDGEAIMVPFIYDENLSDRTGLRLDRQPQAIESEYSSMLNGAFHYQLVRNGGINYSLPDTKHGVYRPLLEGNEYDMSQALRALGFPWGEETDPEVFDLTMQELTGNASFAKVGLVFFGDFVREIARLTTTMPPAKSYPYEPMTRRDSLSPEVRAVLSLHEGIDRRALLRAENILADNSLSAWGHPLPGWKRPSE